ncbi:MAG: hypothetical protein LBL35_03445 [Clostridiales bacterium]|jgi:hypothetical protein|nr:hypothetical protein [Clostridiales bacterium]
MARFNSFITEWGARELTRAAAEGAKLSIGLAKVGDGRADDPTDVSDIVNEVDVECKVAESGYTPPDGENEGFLRVTVDILNGGLDAPVAVREIGLYSGANLFAYAWLDGEDTDNVLPAPATLNSSDAVHQYDVCLLVTSDENAAIDIEYAITVADNALIASISERIGFPFENDAMPTIFGVIKSVTDAVDEIGAEIGEGEGQSVFERLSAIESEMRRGTVKRIQRGAVKVVGNMPTTVSILPIDPQKCSVTVSGTYGYFSSGSGGITMTYGAIVKEVGETAIVIDGSSNPISEFWYPAGPFSWEIIEYY